MAIASSNNFIETKEGFQANIYKRVVTQHDGENILQLIERRLDEHVDFLHFPRRDFVMDMRKNPGYIRCVALKTLPGAGPPPIGHMSFRFGHVFLDV